MHVAHVARVAQHGNGSGAAQVVRHDAARDAVGLAEFLEGVAEWAGEAAVLLVGLKLRAGAAGPELEDEGARIALAALVDEFANGARDWQREARTVFAGEAEFAGLRVKLCGTEARGCARADGEVGAEKDEEAQMRRRAVDEAVDLFAVCGDVARTRAGIATDVLVELGRAVVFPQPPENDSYGAGLACFRGALIATTREGVVNLVGVRRGELVGRDAAGGGDDGFGRATIFPFPVAEERGE